MKGVGRTRALCLVLLLAGCLLQVAAGYFHRDLSGHALGTDDAFISFRYALNLATGQGLTFNPGDRVEGYTNFLFVLLVTPFALLGPDAVYPAATVINVASALLMLWLVGDVLVKETRPAVAAVLLALVALSTPLWIAAGSGLETSLVVLLQVATWWLVRRPRVPVGALALVFAAMTLLRADGFVYVTIAGVWLGLNGRWRVAAVTVGSAACVLAAHVGFRLWYYGDLLPNTYYAKVGGTLGQRLVAAYSQARTMLRHEGGIGYAPYLAAIAVLGGGALAALPAGPAAVRARLPFHIWAGLGLMAYWLYVGGDVFGERFLLACIPFGAVAIAELLERVPGRSWPLAVVGAVLAAAQLLGVLQDRRMHLTYPKYDRWVVLGKFMAAAHPGAVIATSAAGKIPFYSGAPTIDMLGLNDRTIARQETAFREVGHDKFDAAYVLARRPDFIAEWLRVDDSAPNRAAPGFDLGRGLDEATYRRNGYELRYVVNANRDSRPEGDVVDVRSWSPDQRRRLIDEGFRFVVLQRTG